MSRAFALIAFMTATVPLGASAQPPLPADPPPIVIELRPAAQPRPALKYRLVPEQSKLVPGNAAIFYHRAIQMMIERRASSAASAKQSPEVGPVPIDEQINRLGYVPLAEFSSSEARKLLAKFENVLKEIELGAHRATCDWEFDQRTEGISLLLPEIQEMRTLARLVRLRARIEVVDGKTDAAMHWIQIGLIMGRHVAQGPIAIQALVGMAIESMMTGCLIDLIQTPGTPSLYWALADRPQPFINLRPSLEGERYLLEREIPKLNDLDRRVWSVSEAREFTNELQIRLFELTSGEPIPGTNVALPNLSSSARRLGIAAMATKIYPQARQTLIAEGRPEAEVEAMPVVQVAALSTFEEYKRLRDESYKWMNLPYWQSFSRVDQANRATVEERLANPLLTMFRSVTPALSGIRINALRVDRQFDALACVEAIRLYAHAHAGQLPASLDEIIDAPAPRDPATGQPFVYRAEGDSATLAAPVPPGGPNHHSFKINYLLKLVK